MIQQFRPRSTTIDGLQVVVGATTKRQILEFCPGANVGAPADASDSYGKGHDYGMDSSDLRWVILPNKQELVDGDWIMRSDGYYFRCIPGALDKFWERVR